MLVLPAIDLKNGKCVRLQQGRMDQETVYGGDPAAMARQFASDGAKMLHLVDLDGAFRGESGNLDSIRGIRQAVDIPLELGGGMRSLEDIEGMLDLGVDSVIVGTLAVRNPGLLENALERFGPERIQLGIDAREGKVAVSGWYEETALDAVEFGRDWRRKGIERIIFTDIARDGMLTGPNIRAIGNFARETGARVTASGGISSIADVEEICGLEPAGVDRVIIGKAIYEGAVKLADVVNL